MMVLAGATPTGSRIRLDGFYYKHVNPTDSLIRYATINTIYKWYFFN